MFQTDFIVHNLILHSSNFIAGHTSNTGMKPKPNPEAEVITKTVDLVVVHLITYRIEQNRMFYYPNMASFGCTRNPFMPRGSGKQYRPRSDAAKRIKYINLYNKYKKQFSNPESLK